MAKEKQETAQTAAPEKPYDPMKDMVAITLPRATGKEEPDQFVALNGKGYTIRKGATVQVPRPVADILRERERMIDRQYAYKEAQAGNGQ